MRDFRPFDRFVARLGFMPPTEPAANSSRWQKVGLLIVAASPVLTQIATHLKPHLALGLGLIVLPLFGSVVVVVAFLVVRKTLADHRRLIG